MALTFLGEIEFVQSGPPQWQQSLWDLDSLVVPYSGAIDNLNTFLDSLEKGQPSDIDADMLLVDWRVGGSKAYPAVDLIYTGKKNGILPPGRHSTRQPIQSASASGGQLTLEYATRVPVYSWISTEEGIGGLDVPPSPPPSTAGLNLTGTSFLYSGTTITGTGTAFATEVSAGDAIFLRGGFNSAHLIVTGVGGNTTLTVSQTNPFPDITFTSAIRVRLDVLEDIGITVVAVRVIDEIVIGEDVDIWGPIWLAAYFTPLITSTIESEEIVPERYWKNTQQILTTIIPYSQ